MNPPGGTARWPLAIAAAATILVVSCDRQPAPTRPSASFSAPAPTTTRTQENVDLTRAESALVGLAREKGTSPTDVGLSVARQANGHVVYIWESGSAQFCFAQVAVEGATRQLACGHPQSKPRPASYLTAVFGPGIGFAGRYVVLAADPGGKVTSVRYEGKELTWSFIRRMSPAATGRDIYYITLPDRVQGWLDVTLLVGDQQKADRLWLGK
ncbi:hypothetical protein OHT93_13130 [Streptomyces sp. NBC_00191]|uniref:hypothetical protein n=1 Tax=Streptomyces sp. NBC_00191 TaxID=2975674 RepID=UPI00324601BB